MNNTVNYAIQVMVSSGFFYGFYKLFMEKETHFAINRAYLLITLFLSLTIPFIQIPIQSGLQTTTFREFLQPILVGGTPLTANNHISVQNLILFIYLMGVFLLSSRFFWGLIQLQKIKNSAKNGSKNGYQFKLTNQEIAPFSFWNTIYLNAQFKDSEELDTILLHESIHIKQFHTIDVLLFETATILFWFNPFFHLGKKSIKEQHEFIVDNIIQRNKTEIKTYLLLLCHTSGIRFNITNNFNKPLIIKRMKKMAQNPSRVATQYKLLLTIPIIVGLVVLFSIQNSNAESIILSKSNNNSIIVSSDIVNDTLPKKNHKFTEVEKPAVFQGGNEQLPIFLGENIKYPDESRKKGISGVVIIEFTITKDGSIEDVKVVKGVDPLLDNEAIRVVKMMPKWTPAENKGEKVNMNYTLPINFKLQ
ncbi:MAG: cell envelope biosis protein TonB [Bacteroidetes bacterium]|nr:cell envelope biosis protein TonB [Bacteroidota bacterium]